MPTETLTGLTKEQADKVEKQYLALGGYTVEKRQQPDGRWTVIATPVKP